MTGIVNKYITLILTAYNVILILKLVILRRTSKRRLRKWQQLASGSSHQEIPSRIPSSHKALLLECRLLDILTVPSNAIKAVLTQLYVHYELIYDVRLFLFH